MRNRDGIVKIGSKKEARIPSPLSEGEMLYGQTYGFWQDVSIGGYDIVDLGEREGYLLGQHSLVGQGLSDIPSSRFDLEIKPKPGRYVCATLLDQDQFKSVEMRSSRTYEPMKVKEIYHRLAQTAPTEEGVLRFVKEFGRIGREVYLCWDPSNETGRHVLLEPVERYVAEIVRMKMVIDLLNCSKKRKGREGYDIVLNALDSIFETTEGEDGIVFPSGTSVIKETWINAAPARQTFRSYYPNSQANSINIDWQEQLGKAETLQLLARNFATEHTNIELLRGVSPIALFDPRVRNLHMCPRYLLAAMYLQIAIDIAGVRGVRTCANCGKSLPAGSTAGRKTCSDRCRKALSDRHKGESQ